MCYLCEHLTNKGNKLSAFRRNFGVTVKSRNSSCDRGRINSKKKDLEWKNVLPHHDRIVSMIVDKIERIGNEIIIVRLRPKVALTDCFCQFIPGQYVEVWIPDTEWLSRAYSIGNSPREDGSIDLQIRRQEGGRFTTRAFVKMKIGDEISVRGPLGNFTLFSERQPSIIFIVVGTICSNKFHDRTTN